MCVNEPFLKCVSGAASPPLLATNRGRGEGELYDGGENTCAPNNRRMEEGGGGGGATRLCQRRETPFPPPSDRPSRFPHLLLLLVGGGATMPHLLASLLRPKGTSARPHGHLPRRAGRLKGVRGKEGAAAAGTHKSYVCVCAWAAAAVV